MFSLREQNIWQTNEMWETEMTMRFIVRSPKINGGIWEDEFNNKSTTETMHLTLGMSDVRKFPEERKDHLSETLNLIVEFSPMKRDALQESRRDKLSFVVI